MADLASAYTLTTPGGTVVLNGAALKSLTDVYWIQNIRGLDSPTIRKPVDDAPQADGAIVHDFYFGAQYVFFEGVILIQSVPFGWDCREQLNDMEYALRDALNSILRADGTLAWTPLGQAAESLTVRYDTEVEFPPRDGYATREFTFGLISESPL